MKVECKNVVIRDYMEKDIYDILEIYSDPITTEFFMDERISKIEEARILLKKKLSTQGVYAICLKDDTVVGEVMMVCVDKGKYEISPIIKSKYMRNKYSTESVLKLIDVYTERLGAYSFIAYADKNNFKFINFLTSLGFINTKEFGSKLVFEL